MKRILHCTLILMVLVMSGCELISGPSETTDSTNPRPIDLANMSKQVKTLIDNINSQDKLTTGILKQDVQKILLLFGNDEGLSKTQDAKASLQKVVDRLAKEKADTVINEQIKNEIVPDLKDASTKLEEAQRLNKPKDGRTITDYLMWAAMIVGGVLVLVLVVSALNYLWKRAWKTVEFNMGKVVAAHVAASREVQPDYAPKLSSLSSAQAEMSSRLSELDTEVRSLARFVRESLASRRSDRNDGFNYQSHIQEPAPKEEPEFPVSATDYLGKMNRFANVVRPDFQNGILVNSPDGDGEFMLIRDSRDESQPLFVVPRATQFHTKQDFYTYYQKYYDCVRPSAGDVWIIGPAVVEKVSGGWQLREKGMLEVR